MKLTEKQVLFAQNVAELIIFIFDNGYMCTLGEAFRTKEQAEIYAKSGIGIVNSQHCKRLAIDLNLFSQDGEYLTETKYYKKFGEYWKTLDFDNVWGGDFKSSDGNHFEMKG